jgi:hypothetical protein
MGDGNIGLIIPISADASESTPAFSQFSDAATTATAQAATGLTDLRIHAMESGDAVRAITLKLRELSDTRVSGEALRPLREELLKAQDELARTQAAIRGFGQAGAADLGRIDQGLFSNREAARLLSEEFGLRLPRAVTTAVSSIQSIGPVLAAAGEAALAVFAVREIAEAITNWDKLKDKVLDFLAPISAAEVKVANLFGFLKLYSSEFDRAAEQGKKDAEAGLELAQRVQKSQFELNAMRLSGIQAIRQETAQKVAGLQEEMNKASQVNRAYFQTLIALEQRKGAEREAAEAASEAAKATEDAERAARQAAEAAAKAAREGAEHIRKQEEEADKAAKVWTDLYLKIDKTPESLQHYVEMEQRIAEVTDPATQAMLRQMNAAVLQREEYGEDVKALKDVKLAALPLPATVLSTLTQQFPSFTAAQKAAMPTLHEWESLNKRLTLLYPELTKAQIDAKTYQLAWNSSLQAALPTEREFTQIQKELTKLFPELSKEEIDEKAAQLARNQGLIQLMTHTARLTAGTREYRLEVQRLTDAIRQLSGVESVEMEKARQMLVTEQQLSQDFMHTADATLKAGVAAAIYEKNIGKAMEAAAKSAVASVAEQAAVNALNALAWGIYCLAQAIFGDPAAGAAAGVYFEAAAEWGLIAGVAGAAAAAIPGGGAGGAGKGAGGTYGPGGSGGGAYGGVRQSGYNWTSETGPGGGGALAPGAAAPLQMPGGNLTVMVVGESGAAHWLAGTLNKGQARYGVNLNATRASLPVKAGR